METIVEEYNNHFKDLEKASKKWEEELNNKQNEEFETLKKQLQDQLVLKLKYDKEYNNLVKQEELLVKTMKFTEAHEIKVKREKLLKKNEAQAKKA